jgi:hypothetical protein
LTRISVVAGAGLAAVSLAKLLTAASRSPAGAEATATAEVGDAEPT